MTERTGADVAREMDEADPLAPFRDRFHLPGAEGGDPDIYLCGNSLGLQPRATADLLRGELEDWATLGVRGHHEGRRPWLRYHELLAESGARLVGARPEEVVHMNTLTVNLHLMMASFFRPDGARRKILIERHAFPSDRYAVASQLEWHGLDPEENLIEVARLCPVSCALPNTASTSSPSIRPDR